MNRFMKEMHKANDEKNQSQFDFYKRLFVEQWNEQTYHADATAPRITTELGSDDNESVNIGGFWFRKA